MRVKHAIAQRIRRACAHMDSWEFDALVERMANIEIKYSMRRLEIVMPRASRSHG